jgi:hypothetical protein
MKKFFTAAVALTAVAMCATAAETSLRDQVVGKYVGTDTGEAWLTVYGEDYTTNYSDEDGTALVIEAGEGENDIVVKNLVQHENSAVTDLKGTVTASSEYDGYLGYITIPAQECGQITYMTDGDYKAYFHRYWYYDADQGQTVYESTAAQGDVEIWITSDYQIQLYGNGWSVLMDYYGDGSAYYNAIVGGYTGALTKVEEPAVSYPEKLWLIGQPEGWDINGKDEYTLAQTEEGVYNGKFEVASGEWAANFRFYAQPGDWDKYSIGWQNDDQSGEFEFTNGVFEGTCVYDAAGTGGSKGAWYFPNWEGGEMDMTVNLKDLTVKFVGAQASVKNLSVDESASVYYTISGMQVNNSNLAPGLYIKRQGNKTTKVLVK